MGLLDSLVFTQPVWPSVMNGSPSTLFVVRNLIAAEAGSVGSQTLKTLASLAALAPSLSWSATSIIARGITSAVPRPMTRLTILYLTSWQSRLQLMPLCLEYLCCQFKACFQPVGHFPAGQHLFAALASGSSRNRNDWAPRDGVLQFGLLPPVQ